MANRAERTGTKVRRISFYEDAATISEDSIVSNLRKGISDCTRVIAVTWVHSSTGVKLLLRAMADAIDEVNRKRAEEDQVPVGEHMSPGGFHSFEHRWALPAAFELHLQLDKAKVQKRIHQLNTQTKEGLAKMSHVKLYTPMSSELSAGLVCFDVEGIGPQEVVKRMHDKGIGICCDIELGWRTGRINALLRYTQRKTLNQCRN